MLEFVARRLLDLDLSERARSAWRAFEDFVYGDARDDLRGMDVPNLG